MKWNEHLKTFSLPSPDQYIGSLNQNSISFKSKGGRRVGLWLETDTNNQIIRDCSSSGRRTDTAVECKAVMQSLAVGGERSEESTQNMPGVKKYSSTSSSLVLQSYPPFSPSSDLDVRQYNSGQHFIRGIPALNNFVRNLLWILKW